MPAIPKREEQLARPRSRKGRANAAQPVKRGTMRPVAVPERDPDWHPIAHRMWDSLISSGQADFFQDSDWAFAYSLCDDLTYYKNSTRRSPEMLKALMGGMASLLMTELDRRKVRVELHEPEPERADAALVAISDYRKRLEA